MELTKKQSDGLNLILQRYKAGEKYSVLAGFAGSGKAQPVDTIIPTPDGYRKLGDIKPGDYVYDRIGNPTKVLSIHPQGMLDSYIVTFEDGRQTKCNDEHLFSYYTSKGNLATKSIKDMLSMGLKYNGKGAYKFKIPVFKGIEYSEKQYDIDPYVIGAMIGDGCCKQRLVTISSETDEIPNEIGRLIGASPVRDSELNYNWSFKWNETHYTKSSVINRTYEQNKPQNATFFKDFSSELLCGAEEKHIPEIYKRGSRQQRFDLLQGLFDTDGSINKNDGNRFNVKYTSINYNLILEIQTLLYELGYKSSIVEDNRSDKYTTGKCYSLNINIPNEDKINFFRLKRKKELAEKAASFHKRKDYSKMAIVSVEKEDIQREMVCIYVDNEEHLYLTNDYIVTHNTTLVRFLVEALAVEGINPDMDIAYACYCGKAVQVLIDKGNRNAVTLHKLLYTAVPTEDGKFFFKKKPIGELEYKIIIVDEVSMVSQDFIDLLLSHPCHVIFCGDPQQLGAVKGNGNHLLDHPHVFLDEIHRQAAESGIIQLSMLIRQGKPFRNFKSNDAIVLPKSELNTGMLLWADQIICATNATRISLNSQVRQLKGYTNPIEEGESLICLTNEWDVLSDNGNALTNGTIGTITNMFETWQEYPRYLQVKNNKVPLIGGNFISNTGDNFGGIFADKQCIITGTPYLDGRTKYKIGRVKKYQNTIPYEFTYSYAATCWKFQGSSAGKVLGIEEKFPYDKDEHRRYLYTLVTRAEDKCVLLID